jgi:hypothetical protein
MQARRRKIDPGPGESRRRPGRIGGPTQGAVQAVDERIEMLGLELIEAAEVGDEALAGGAAVSAVCLDDLQKGRPPELDRRVNMTALHSHQSQISSVSTPQT